MLCEIDCKSLHCAIAGARNIRLAELYTHNASCNIWQHPEGTSWNDGALIGQKARARAITYN